MPRAPQSFRVGKVQAFLRNQVWYLCYHEHGKRHRPRVGPDRAAAKQLAAQINAQLAVGAPAAMSFKPISIPDLRQCWLDHHEHTLRSSVHTIRRYHAATDHLITIGVNGDSKNEANETFYLDLSGLSSNGLFTKSRGVGTILNDD